MSTTNRQTVDLSGHPDLIVIYLGMRVNRWRGLPTMLGFGPRIGASVEASPDGLLLHENLIFSLFPPHAGMRQYWRDFDSLERWSRSEPHRIWWQQFVRDTGGTGFWHELYSVRGGFEAVYDNVEKPVGMLRFAPAMRARGAVLSARRRLRRGGQEAPGAVVPDDAEEVGSAAPAPA
ncbi:MAG TPA: phenylacetaldoxime dehydratase family protein [Candidatus Dormibacteraeota bacterium]